MTRKEVVDLLDGYVDEEPGAEIAADYATHLANCSDCRRLFASSRRTTRLAAGAYSGAGGFFDQVSRRSSRAQSWPQAPGAGSDGSP
jgi:predicted anti-sigma-YlaC factor YlaD